MRKGNRFFAAKSSAHDVGKQEVNPHACKDKGRNFHDGDGGLDDEANDKKGDNQKKNRDGKGDRCEGYAFTFFQSFRMLMR